MSAMPPAPWRPNDPQDQTMNPMNPMNPMTPMHQTPAYHAIPDIRRTFDRSIMAPVPAPPAPIPAQEPQKKRPERQWPDSVRQYVQRCFAEQNAIAGIGREEMESKLKQIITNAAESKTLDSIDWQHMLLPQEIIQAERNKYYTMPVPANNDQMYNTHIRETNVFSNGTPSKKRKSNEYAPEPGSDVTTTIPPWRNSTNNVAHNEGMHNDKRLRTDPPSKQKSPWALDKEKRKRRFEGNAPPSPYVSSHENSPGPNAAPAGPVIGRCQTLEKNYFRLTAAPNPDTVRPLNVLKDTLDLLKKKWRKDNNYSYICDQFKSLRQDLTVQHIRNEFTVTVYEIHARIALEKGDLGEYNQCQTQLRTLYSLNLGGHPTEFKAYRILYFLYTGVKRDMNDALADLTPADKQAPAVKHALDARSALALGNYHRFFKLYLETPNMGAYLMDKFVDRERLAALANLTKAFKPDLKLRYITDELGFESDTEAATFICQNGGGDFLEEKDGEVRLITGKSAGTFEAARKAAFQSVDLKGQI